MHSGPRRKSGKSRQNASSIKHIQHNKMERIEAENDYLKKALSYEKEDEVKRDKSIEYQIIYLLKSNFASVLLCEMAGISRSGYYKWSKRRTTPSEKKKEDEFIMSKVVECEQDQDINGSFGYPRVCTWLKKKYDLQINHKRVYV